MSTTKKPGQRDRVSAFVKTQYPVLVPVALAAVVVAIVQWTHPVPPGIHDALAYVRTAVRLLSKGYYSYDAGKTPNAVQTPGYPLFLAAVFALVRGARTDAGWAKAARPVWVLAQTFMVLGIVGSLAQSGRLIGGRRVGLLAGLFAALYLPYAWASTVSLSDLLGTLLVTVELLVAVVLTAPGKAPRMRTFALLGIMAAAVALVRPAYMPWAAVPLIYVAVQRAMPWRRLIMGIAICAFSFVLVMSPWWIRNAVTFHQVILLNTNSADTMLDSLGGREFSAPEQQVADAATSRGADAGMAVALMRLQQQWNASPLQFVAERGSRAVEQATVPWNVDFDAYWEQYYHYDVNRIDYGSLPIPPPAFLPALEQAMYVYQLLLMGAAIVGLFYIRRSPRLLLAASLPVYSIVVHWVTLFINRYFLPAMGGVFLLAAAGCVGLWITVRRCAQGRRRAAHG